MVVSRKASAMAIDAKRGRHWFLHYTNGLHVRGRRGPTKHLDMRRLQYMRALWLDPDGSVWVGGWNALVHVIPGQGKGPFRERSYEVSAATMPATP